MGENFNPINAHQAKEATDTFVEAQEKTELANIFNQIRAQIVLGKYEITTYKQLSESNKKTLKDLGFKIYEGPSYCCTSNYETDAQVLTTISWRNG